MRINICSLLSHENESPLNSHYELSSQLNGQMKYKMRFKRTTSISSFLEFNSRTKNKIFNMKLIIVSFAFVAAVSAGAVSYQKRSDDGKSSGYGYDSLTSTGSSGLGYGYGNGYESYGGDYNKDYYAYPKYKFEYGVKDPHTGDHKSQWEIRDGDVVKGEYTLDEADGTKRVVEYHADGKSGFHAKVKKIGHAHHPNHYETGYGYGY
jgi:hypothetical protein